ncbi:hypothetical protein COCON_G00064380 [Conger conger]|uniref:Peptidase A2 domain-containing protein n=1 Tax=Conger conger TaxID=82655 RepID=A0A9Q1DS34_CONCO|nr:hypothetical protein COCON_G00064380 [Conger conger]
MGTETEPTCPDHQLKQHADLKQSTAHPPVVKLPKGLVGSKCTAVVNIAGVESNCLLDTGSQVTTIPVSFYNQNLSDQQVKPLNKLLEVEGAAGQSVPHLGYVEMTVAFPKDFLGANFEVPTLALVVPDLRPDTPLQVLIGTNTLDVLYELYSNSEIAGHQPSSYGYRAVLKTLELRHKQTKDGRAGVIRLLSRAPVLVPAGHTVILEGSAKVQDPFTDRWAIVEHPTRSSLPGGLSIQTRLITLSSTAPHKVPGVVANDTEQAITISPLSVIAELGAFHSIICQHSVTSSHVSEEEPSSGLNFNFGDSPLPPEWKERLTEKLGAMP